MDEIMRRLSLVRGMPSLTRSEDWRQKGKEESFLAMKDEVMFC